MELISDSHERVLVAFAHEEWTGARPLLESLGLIVQATQGHVLPIPHVSQLGIGANARRGDCGAASAAMCIRGLTNHRPDVDDVALSFQKARVDRSMTMGEVMQALRHYGLNSEYVRPLPVDQIANHVRKGKPVIALVKYPVMPMRFSTYQHSHFVVVYGVDGNDFLYHDPLALAGEANTLRISRDLLDYAMKAFDPSENMPHQGIVVSG